MYYIFVINGRKDYADRIKADLDRQLSEVDIAYEFYFTEGVGDGTRFVRIYCDLHRKKEVCFIACGGSGTANEVASGIVGFEGKSMAFLAYGATNDFTKYYDELDFTSLKKILQGELRQIDIIKANDSYSMNVINVGFDASVAYLANRYLEQGLNGVRAFRKGLWDSLITRRLNGIRVVADGERLNKKVMLLCSIGNASWCGGQYHCSPKADTEDGLMEVCLLKPMLLMDFVRMLPKYTKGTYLEDKFSLKRLEYRQVKHVELDSKDLIYISNDGEIVASSHFDIDILPKALNIVLPAKKDQE